MVKMAPHDILNRSTPSNRQIPRALQSECTQEPEILSMGSTEYSQKWTDGPSAAFTSGRAPLSPTVVANDHSGLRKVQS